MKDFGLYLVMTDPAAGYVKCAEAAVKAGVGIIQLRMKHTARAEVLAQAREIRKATAGSRTLFIVNDDPAVAEESGADGVHVGQDDMPPAEVRAKFPGLKIVGLSTHNVSQVEASLEQDVDYIGVGPVFATPTKDVPDPVLGLETMARMIDLAKCPAVAIGGIDASRVDVVRTAGARNWAVVRAVCQSADPYRAILALMR